jgi:hypothetical protein
MCCPYLPMTKSSTIKKALTPLSTDQPKLYDNNNHFFRPFAIIQEYSPLRPFQLPLG